MGKREDYQKKLETQLSELGAEINKIKGKAEKAGAEYRKEFASQLELLKDKQSEAKERLEELRETSSDAWEDLREGLDKTWDSLSKAVKTAASRFK